MQLTGLALALVLLATTAHAYVGPGMGAGAIAAVVGAIVSVFVAIFAIVYYPIKRMMKKRKATPPADSGKNGNAEKP